MGGITMIKTLKTLIAVAALSGTVSANAQAAEVTVQKGDTLWNIAKVHNATVENIKAWNHLSTNVIFPEEKLITSEEKQYTVKQDDTLWGISKENHVTVGQLMDWNHLNSTLIHPGLKLTISEIGNTDSAQAATTSGVKKQAVSQTQESEGKSAAAKTTGAVQTGPANTSSGSGKTITVVATAYTASCGGCSGITATGVNLKQNPNARVISVDPSVIPLGSKVMVQGYGVATAADTGGAIKGNRIDVYMPSQSDALQFGKKQLQVTILN